jgi:hypothetical protein
MISEVVYEDIDRMGDVALFAESGVGKNPELIVGRCSPLSVYGY